MDTMDEITKTTEDSGTKKRTKLKRIAKKKPKFQLNSSINSKVFSKSMTMHKNNIMNTSVVKATLRANNKALAQSLEKVRLDLRTANDMIMMEKKEKQELQQRVATLTRVAGLKDEQFETETNTRIEAKLRHLKSLLLQTSTHLFDAGLYIQQAMEECFSSRLSQCSNPRGSSIGFTTSDDDRSPVRSRKNREMVYRSSDLKNSPLLKDDLDTATIQQDDIIAEMSMILEKSVIAGSPNHVHNACLPAVLESAVAEDVTDLLEKQKTNYGIPKHVLKHDQLNKLASTTKPNVLETEVENLVCRNSRTPNKSNKPESAVQNNVKSNDNLRNQKVTKDTYKYREEGEKQELEQECSNISKGNNKHSAVLTGAKGNENPDEQTVIDKKDKNKSGEEDESQNLQQEYRNTSEENVKQQSAVNNDAEKANENPDKQMVANKFKNKQTEEDERQKLRRGTYVLLSPSVHSNENKADKLKGKDIDRRGTFILPSKGNKLPISADQVESSNNGKRETFCVPKINTFSSESEQNGRAACKEAKTNDQSVFKHHDPLVKLSHSLTISQSIVKHPSADFLNQINQSEPQIPSTNMINKAQDFKETKRDTISEEPQNDQSAFKQPNIESTDKTNIEHCLSSSEDQTVYFNSDMELTAVIDISSSTNQNNTDDKKTKLPISLRVSKPGKLTFAAARKENDGTRKIIPTKLPLKARSKSKKQLRKLQEAIAADKSKPKNIFDFHDKTPNYLQEKPSVFDISLNESASTAQVTVNEYHERLQKLKTTLHNDKENNEDGNQKVETEETKARCSDGITPDNDRKDDECKGKSVIKKSRTKNRKIDSEDDEQTKERSRRRKSNSDIKVHGNELDIHHKTQATSKKKKTSIATANKRKPSSDSEDESQAHVSVKKHSFKLSLPEISLNENEKTARSKSKSKDSEHGISSQIKETEISDKNDEQSFKLFSDLCPIYSLPLKGSPVVKERNKRPRSCGPSSTQSTSKSETRGSRSRSRSCKRINYRELNSGGEEISSEIEQSPEEKQKIGSRGRTLKKKKHQKRSMSRKRVISSELMNKTNDINAEIKVSKKLPRPDESFPSDDETNMKEINKDEKNEKHSSKRLSSQLIYESKKMQSKPSDTICSQSYAQAVLDDTMESDKEKDVEQVISTDPAEKSKTMTHSMPQKESSISNSPGVKRGGNENKENEIPSRIRATSSEKVAEIGSEIEKDGRNITVTRSKSRKRIVDDDDESFDVQNHPKNTFTSVHRQKSGETTERDGKLLFDSCSQYTLPLKGSPSPKNGAATSSRRSRSRGPTSKSTSKSRKKIKETQHFGEVDCTIGSPQSLAEKLSTRSHGRCRRTLTRSLSESRKSINRESIADSEESCTDARLVKQIPERYVLKKKTEKLINRKVANHSKSDFSGQTLENAEEMDNSMNKSRKKTTKNFLAMFDKNSNSKTDLRINSETQDDKPKDMLKCVKKSKFTSKSPTDRTKQLFHQDLLKKTPDNTPQKTSCPDGDKTQKENGLENAVQQSLGLDILKRKLALIQGKDNEPKENLENNGMNCKRSRRAVVGISYKLPSLIQKMRRGDPGTSTLYGDDSVPVFKKSPVKSDSTKLHTAMADVTNWKS